MLCLQWHGLIRAVDPQDIRVKKSSRFNCDSMLMDSGVSAYYLNDCPRLREKLSDYVRMEEPRETTTAGNHKLKGVSAGINRGYIIDKAGVRQEVTLPVVACPDFGRNLFSVPSATEQGITSPGGVADRDPNGFITPLQEAGGHRALHTFKTELERVGLALLAEVNADHWHRRMGRVNAGFWIFST